MASRGHKLNLRDCLLDTPKVHSHLSQFEATLSPFRDYVSLLRDTFQACHLHQAKVGEGTRALANLLNSIDSELGEKTLSTSLNAFAQLSGYQTELYSCQEMFNSQLQISVVNRVSALLDEDMDTIQTLKETYESSRLEHEHAMIKFSRTSRRKDSEKVRFEANAELYTARKKFYQCTVDYCAQLNEFQMRKKVMLLEPILTFMHAQMGYFKACHEIMNAGFQQLLTSLNGEIQSYHGDYENEVTELRQQKVALELQFPSLCVPDPDPSDPFTEFPAANTTLTSKFGYLYLRIQKGGLAAKWERTFFFTKNGYLYTQSLQKSAEALLHLREAEACLSDCDDRRYIMQISHNALKKPVFMQAESAAERSEWIAVINNNSVRKTQHGPAVGGQSADATRLRTRLYDSLERERIRTWATKELNQGTTTANTSTSLKVATPPRSRSPLKDALKTTPRPESGSQDSKSPQRGLGFLGRSGKKSSFPALPLQASSSVTLPPGTLVGSKMADVESWVISTNAAAVLPPQRPLNPASSTTAGSSAEFFVKYLGQKEVQDPKHSSTISTTIRGVMTARAVKKVKPATSIELAIQHKKIMLTEVQANKTVGWFQLKDIVNCEAHHEDQKLFGVVCRVTSQTEPDKTKFICHVMQADQSGAQVCAAISNAIQSLWKTVQSKGGIGHRSSTDITSKSMGHPLRPPPPIPPYTGSLASLLGSYTPVPAGLTTHHHHHQRGHTSPGVLQHHSQTSSLHPRSSSDSNLTGMAPRQGGSGPREELGVAGSGTMSIMPPSLPESSSTSADSLSLGHQDEGVPLLQDTNSAVPPLMFANILEENEDIPLISFDQSTLGGDTTALDSTATPLDDGYVGASGGGGEGGGGGGGEFRSPTPTAVSGGYMSSPQPSSVSPSPSPTPPVVTSSQLTLPPHTTTTRPSPSPPLPAALSPSPSHTLSTQLTPAVLPPKMQTIVHTTSTSNNHVDTMPVKPPRKNKNADSKTGQTAPAPALSAADSLAQALGFDTIPPAAVTESSNKGEVTSSKDREGETTGEKSKRRGTTGEKSHGGGTTGEQRGTTGEKSKQTGTTGEKPHGGGTAAVVKSSATDSLAEAFGFDTTPEDIENLLELMGPPDSNVTSQSLGRNMDSGYMTSNPMQTEASDDTKWDNF